MRAITFCVFYSEEEVRSLVPDIASIAKIERFAVIVTAPGREGDFVSRFFAPGSAYQIIVDGS
jgi:predicted PhzF superfamily epimerase YddE/YHI9